MTDATLRPPLVSLCIPTFNHATTVGEAIESARLQTYPNLEILILDNHSTDRTSDIVAEAVSADPRIRHIRHSQNLGMARNFTECVRHARGEFVQILCDDDILAETCVERLVTTLVCHPSAVMVACARIHVDVHGRSMRPATRQRRRILRGLEGRLTIFARGNVIGEPSAVMFRRAAAANGFPESYRHAVDIGMWMQLLAAGDLVFVPDPLCSIRVHPEQATLANLRSGAVLADKETFFNRFEAALASSLPVWSRLMWDARLALTAIRTERAGGTVHWNRMRDLFFPRLFRFLVVPVVALAVTLRGSRYR